MENEELVNKLSQYTFYQTIDLGNGIKTPGLPTDVKQKKVLQLIGDMDLSGKSAIDIGCASGLFALEAEKRGAARVVGADHTEHNIECLREVILPHLGSKIEPLHVNMLDLNPEEHGQFDLVIFAGVLYHLKYPFSALKVVRDLVKSGGTMILETGIYDDYNRRAALYTPSPKDTPLKGRFAKSCAFFNEKALIENLEYFGFRVVEKTVVNDPFKRFVKKIVGTLTTSFYPVSNIVIKCERDPSIENKALTRFYESVTGK